jgi:dual specificity phosphatase 12
MWASTRGGEDPLRRRTRISRHVRFRAEMQEMQVCYGCNPDLAYGFLLMNRTTRRPLATSQYLTSHEPLRDSSGEKSSNTSPACGHFFLDALSWMRPELEQGKLDGRLECPKCRANVGKYAWQGMQCSCGDWVLPAISLQKARVDAARTRPTGSGAGGMGIRMPPGGRPSGGQNL